MIAYCSANSRCGKNFKYHVKGNNPGNVDKKALDIIDTYFDHHCLEFAKISIRYRIHKEGIPFCRRSGSKFNRKFYFEFKVTSIFPKRPKSH
jgi:hypothetical protein